MAASTLSTPTFPPDRKIWSGGLAGIITAVLVWAAQQFLHWTVPMEVQTLIPVVIGYIVSYFVPPSVKDIVKRVDDTIIEVARASNDSPASAVQPAVMTPETKVAVAEEKAKQ